MKRESIRAGIGLLAAGVFAFVFAAVGPAMSFAAGPGAGTLKAGVAMRVVNPSKPAIPIGHRGTTPYNQVHADLRVHAVAFEDHTGKRIIWLGADFCNVLADYVDGIKETLRTKYGLDPKNVCINASHTHSAPPLMASEALKPEFFDQAYADHVRNEMIAVVGDALAKLTLARLRYCEDICKVGINRRRFKDGRMVMLPNPPGVVDHRAQVIAIESVDGGKLIGAVVKYACHPVTVGPRGLGSDYPGFMRKFVEAARPGAVVVFLQGCCGNVRIRAVNEDMSGWVNGDAKMAERFGRDLADAVERALKKTGSPMAGPVEADYAEITLPIRKLDESTYRNAAKKSDHQGAWGKKFTQMLDSGQAVPLRVPYRIQAFRFGAGPAPFTLVALQGEVFTEYGLNIGKALAPRNTIVLGYSNEIAGYVPTAKAITEGGYEPGAYRYWLVPGPYTTEVEGVVLKAAEKLARTQ